MYNNYDYPCGADTPNAPWNQEDLEPVEVECTFIETLHKDCVVETKDFTYCKSEGISDVQVTTEHFTSTYRTVEEIMNESAKAFKELFMFYKVKADVETNLQRKLQYHNKCIWCKQMLIECEGWESDEQELVQD